MDDREIIAFFWNRDETAIAACRKKYNALLERISRNILSSSQDSEECVSDTYLKAWETIPPKKPDSLAAYLGRIARNLSLNRWNQLHAQKRGEGGSILLSELSDCIPAENSVEAEIETARLTQLIDSWLDTLPQNDRVLFLRRYWYGDSVNALAAEAGSTPSVISGRLYRLRAKLRRQLEKEGISL